MKREKELVIVSHCILNQNSVVLPLARSRGAFPFVKEIIDSGVGIIQLKCPEFNFLGLSREGMTKEEYDTKEYREICKSIAKDILAEALTYIKHGYKIKGIIGINESPTCSITGNRGILMEEVFNYFSENNIELKFLEVSTSYEEENEDKEVIDNLNKMLS
ncbi:CD3072 family TudS-related putative desulfidase [Clostridium chrysemydis]|uniref:CD3072 family TudS-related putative desulfidase n=1 Tax=Clostridium chrysemydis TaxID=2665504 RepID=UPI00188428F8|nr:CD3072 family TudS-related putative desulfidase [Clostridium chrysemydis]